MKVTRDAQGNVVSTTKSEGVTVLGVLAALALMALVFVVLFH